MNNSLNERMLKINLILKDIHSTFLASTAPNYAAVGKKELEELVTLSGIDHKSLIAKRYKLVLLNVRNNWDGFTDSVKESFFLKSVKILRTISPISLGLAEAKEILRKVYSGQEVIFPYTLTIEEKMEAVSYLVASDMAFQFIDLETEGINSTPLKPMIVNCPVCRNKYEIE